MIGKNIYGYCSEDISLIENYEMAKNDPTQIWDIHHRRETIYTRDGLIEIGEYYDRPAAELIFLKRSEHNRIHNSGKHHSEDAKKRMREAALNLPEEKRERQRLAVSAARKGKSPWMKGRRHSEESKKLISEKRKSYVKEHPESAEVRESKSLKMADRVFWNNGTICVRSKERPDETWRRGRLPFKRNTSKNKEQ